MNNSYDIIIIIIYMYTMLCISFYASLFSKNCCVINLMLLKCVSYDIFSVVAFILLSKTIHTIIIESND